MKNPKIVITDSREVHYVKMCWLNENPPVRIYRGDLMREAMEGMTNYIQTKLLPAFEDLVRAAEKLSGSFDRFKQANPEN